ncbi:tetratricopeptide repeat protein [uncultured Oxalicibacterium sp.]|uniref:tetratricopeptide repeat protein n=1 Tax=uncultured Oxalicibacterium sp. TaxID=1168540 RepID=UPI0025EDAA2E|nr:tetratricopeptide repeat protein [uncultured Oxalicibacterium sp.]
MNRTRQLIYAITPVLVITTLLSACSTTETGNVASAQYQAMLAQQQAQAEQPAINNRQVHLDMIRTMQARNMYFASLAHIDAYESAHGSSTEVSLLRADALCMTGQNEPAENAYRKLLTSNEAAAARHGLGLMAAQQGKYSQAIEELRQAVRLAPLNAAALGDLGYALMIANRTDEARVPLIQAMELAPDNRKVISNLSLFLILTGDEKKAIELMEKTHVPFATRKEIMQRALQMQQAATPTKIFPVLNASSEPAPENGFQLRLQTSLAPASLPTKRQSIP